MVRTRFLILKDGQAGRWYEKTLTQTEQISRKDLKCGFRFWNFLKSQGKIRYSKQILIDGFWKLTVNNSKI